MVRAIESATFTHMKWKCLRVKGKCLNDSQHEFSLCELTFWKSWMLEWYSFGLIDLDSLQRKSKKLQKMFLHPKINSFFNIKIFKMKKSQCVTHMFKV
jgi:hypothetical protein